MRLDQLALLSLAKTRRSTQTRGLAVTVGVLPLDLHLQRMALELMARSPGISDIGWDGRSHIPETTSPIVDTGLI